MEDQWLGWAKRLNALASTGMHYSSSPYDQERYAEVAAIAQAMLGALGGVPVRRIRDLLPEFAKAYATPLVEVRAAVFADDAILLVQEAGDGLWTLPGGFADVGLSPGENVVKEVREEAGLEVRATALYGLRHKARHAYDPDMRDFYKIFFYCERLDQQPPRPGAETVAAGYFGREALPPLSTGRTLALDIEAAFAFRDDPSRGPFFD